MDTGHVAEFDTPLALFDREDSIFRSLCDEAGLTRADIVRIRDLFEKTLQQIDITNPVASSMKIRGDLDKITFEQWVQMNQPISEDALNALKVGTRALLGVEPSVSSREGLLTL